MTTTARRYTLTIPGFPPSPNERRRMHWATQRRLIAGYRMVAKAEACKWGVAEPLERARVTYTLVYPPRAPMHDPDAVDVIGKPALDGIVDAGVLRDDNRRCVEMGQHRQERGPERCVRVEVEEVA